MKKVLFVLAVVLPLVFSGCSKDDETPLSNDLNGTTWICSGDNLSISLVFSETTAYGTNTEYGRIVYQGTMLYEYRPPIVTFFESGEKTEGRISGNKLTVIGENNEVFEYIKQ
jgi:hypothetical protein